MITPPVRFTAPLTLRQLPEGFIEGLRPGQVISAKVETIEGRLLTLFVGHERLEALISDEVPLHLLKPGQSIKLKVVSLGPPLVLSLGLEKVLSKENFLLILGNIFKALGKKPPFLEDVPREKVLEFFLANLLKKEKTGANETKEPIQKELRDFLLKNWQEGQFLIPFIIGDRVSWGYLAEDSSVPRRKGERVFVLVVFLSRLGLMEARFLCYQGGLTIQLNFASEEAFEKAQKALPGLQEMFSEFKQQVIIKSDRLSATPGQILKLNV
ncbi:hypothetical protein [Thermodesulfatator autotrophicus]|uniref:Uncharacterized protein n=1 Tax=Thermodesulfatator autotrophicus TaxID=1795632 RepID=A0A177E9L6_9BACT|nr:hypothetical protein [Thermodesulfatator autotrophicus]OAG28644.1 hypothetical protein TH606_00660 [Thermodesulfatator autotrophicus]